MPVEKVYYINQIFRTSKVEQKICKITIKRYNVINIVMNVYTKIATKQLQGKKECNSFI